MPEGREGRWTTVDSSKKHLAIVSVSQWFSGNGGRLLNYSLSGLSDEELVLLTHGDSVESNEVAEDFQVIANSGDLVAGLSHLMPL